MGKRTQYAPGTFCWVDLGTSDPAGAKSFYGELFGWQAEDIPAGEGMTYTMLRQDGDQVAALYQLGPQQHEQGVRPHWMSYVSVEDADTTAGKARELGGTVQADPFDVLEAGRMTHVQDPTGATVAIWQPRGHIGATRVNEPGCLSWNELLTPDLEAATEFYSDAFGWETEPIDTGGGPQMRLIRNAGSMNGNITALGGQQGGAFPPSWVPYFAVVSTDEACRRIGDLGGEVMLAAMDIPAGRIAVARDPQGATFALFEGELDD